MPDKSPHEPILVMLSGGPENGKTYAVPELLPTIIIAVHDRPDDLLTVPRLPYPPPRKAHYHQTGYTRDGATVYELAEIR